MLVLEKAHAHAAKPDRRNFQTAFSEASIFAYSFPFILKVSSSIIYTSASSNTWRAIATAELAVGQPA